MVGARTLAWHFHRAIRPALGLTKGNNGPTITAARRAAGSKNIVLQVSYPNGGSALSMVGAPASRFKVYPAGTVTGALAFDATTPITLGASTITLALAADPGDVALDVYAFLVPDPVPNGAADMIYDNVTDGDGITVGRHLAANLAPIAVARPSFGLTMTSATYETGSANFGQRLLGGYGVANPSPLAGAGQTWTIEGRIRLTAAPSSVKVAFGAALKGWIGVNAAGRLVANFAAADGSDLFINGSTSTDAGTNPVITDGIEHHVALVVTSAGATLYLDGVAVGTNAVAPNAADGRQFGVGVLGASSINAGLQWTGSLDEVAVWKSARYTAGFTPPAAAYSGSEANLLAVWHLDGNGTGGLSASPALSMYSAAYGAGSSGFGQRLGGGYGLSNPTPLTGSGQTFTIEGRITLASAPASTKVAFGAGGKAWIGVNTSGRLLGNYSGATDVFIGTSTTSAAGTNPVISDGVEHHVALVVTPAGGTLYLDGAVVASNATAPATGNGNQFAVGALGSSTINSGFIWPGNIDEVAMWKSARYTAAFTRPAAPYDGTEANLLALWHLDGNGSGAVVFP